MFPLSAPTPHAVVCQGRSCFIVLQCTGSLHLSCPLSQCRGWWPGHCPCSKRVEKLWKGCATSLGTCGTPATAHTRHGGHFGPLSKSRPEGWLHLLSNKRYSSLSCFHMLPKARPEDFIIYYLNSRCVWFTARTKDDDSSVWDTYEDSFREFVFWCFSAAEIWASISLQKIYIFLKWM